MIVSVFRLLRGSQSLGLARKTASLEMLRGGWHMLALPSRPGEFHPEPLTDPDVTLSRHPARVIA
jgi:hypothetical protein